MYASAPNTNLIFLELVTHPRMDLLDTLALYKTTAAADIDAARYSAKLPRTQSALDTCAHHDQERWLLDSINQAARGVGLMQMLQPSSDLLCPSLSLSSDDILGLRLEHSPSMRSINSEASLDFGTR